MQSLKIKSALFLMVATLGFAACEVEKSKKSSDDDGGNGGSTRASNSSNSSSSNSSSSNTSSSNTSSSSGAGACANLCAAATSAGCPAENCEADCQAGYDSVPSECHGAFDSYINCGASNVVCTSEGPTVEGCDNEFNAVIECSASSSSATTSSTSSASGGCACAGLSTIADGACTAPDQGSCSCMGCSLAECFDGTNYADCVCPQCATDSFCADPNNCNNDGQCDPFNEGCACGDCAGHPQCN